MNLRQRPEYLPPLRQGMYDPANEHDACGLGFIAHIKGTASHAIITQGLQILKNLTHRGATGADPLPGRWRRHPFAASGRFPASRLRTAGPHPPGAGSLRGRNGLPAQGARVANGVRAGNRARGRKPGAAGARMARRSDRQFRSVGAHQGRRAGHSAGLYRTRVERHRPGRAGAQALHHPQAGRPRHPGAQAAARQGILRSVDVDTDGGLQRHAPGQSGRRVLPGPPRAEHGVCDGHGAPAVLHQHVSDVGPRASVSGWSATTARSTPFAATSTGSGRGSRRSPAACSAKTSTRCGR